MIRAARAVARLASVPVLVLASAAGGAVMGAGLAIGWLLVRRDEGLCWLSGDEMP